MGNVLASSSSSSSTLDAAKVIVPEPAKPGFPTAVSSTNVSEDKLENPGTVDEIHKKCKDVQALTFEGARIMLNKGLSNHFQVSHTLNMSSTQPSGYRFGATYVGTKQFTPSEAFPVLLGDIDPSGNLNANIIHQFTPQLRCKFAMQIQESKVLACQAAGDFKGQDFTASVTLGNPNIINGSGVIVAHYLQSITKRLALGTELAYQYGGNVPGGQIAVVSAIGRYATENYVWSGTAGPAGVHICYYQKASDQLQIGAEVETSPRMQESVATIAYQVDIPKADLIFRGSFDSNWNVAGVLEKRLTPLPFSFALSGRLNHTKNQFRLGCGLIIG
ncbi:mitochondrial import receptor subunit TOM40 homolog 1-like [Teleopsis dalmanni]|uniref:mitochondrial import receptor subunit TOM40 homolog 1-like n=1 Tax=Teleopsis dalmanni TaxID=139649 RepID=UPI000D32CE24|nr:mitochondrial import receptor subunit TOM40 homolog 1-like [Teleopsis dalmanni]XP_037938066.1 mitochondrial import receptor subunit TOM40 homolog 1-like [Teleopsis dalmanni]